MPKIGCDSTRRAIATLGDDDSAVRTSWRSGRGLFRTRSYPQILLKTLKIKVSASPELTTSAQGAEKALKTAA